MSSPSVRFFDYFGLDESQEIQEIILDEDLYDFSDTNFIIDIPCKITSNLANRPVFKCESIRIFSRDVEISNIIFEGSVISKDCGHLLFSNVDFSNGNPGYGGMIVASNTRPITLKNCYLHDSNSPGIFCENITNIEMFHVKMARIGFTAFHISMTVAYISKCRFEDMQPVPIQSTQDSKIHVVDTIIKNSKSLAMNLSQSDVILNRVQIKNVEQNGINLCRCIRVSITNCLFFNTTSSSISIISQKDTQIIHNTFMNIHGNCLIMTDNSEAEFCQNFIYRIDYPSAAILSGSKAIIHQNTIWSIMKAGLCVRGAAAALISDNYFKNITDTGISVSESKNVIIRYNVFKNCNIAAVESYNQSYVSFSDNKLINPGISGFLVYAKSMLEAKNNIVDSPKEALISISTHGSGEFCYNECINCPKQIIGEATGQIYMEGNGDFENLTNDETRVTENVKLLPSIDDENQHLCLKCHKNPRTGFISPCGHEVFCAECGKDASKNQDLCPLCRFPIQSYTPGYSNSLTDDNICSLCLTNPADAVILPCGHTGICFECASKWIRETNSCPVCRQNDATVKRILDDL